MSNQFTPFFLAIAVFFSIASCKKNNDQKTDDIYKKSPSTSIPSSLKSGFWYWGSVGPIAYYDRDGHQVGNGTEAARQYSFSEVLGQGRFEFMQYLGLRNASNCVTEIYTIKKGTVVFEGADKLILYPVEGSFKTIKTGCTDAGTNTRQATADDLKTETYLWEIKVSLGIPQLYIYNITDAGKQSPIFVYNFAQ